MRCRALLSLFALLAAAPMASATTIDVGAGGGADCTFWCTERYQQAYAASFFSGPVLVDSVSFFAAPANGGNTWNGTSTWQMSISTSVNPINALSYTFASNVGGDVALFDTQTFTGTQNLNDLVTFDGAGSFYYDPGNGDLLIDIVRIAGPAFGVGSDAGVNGPGVSERAYAFNGTTTADNVGPPGYTNRTRFVLLPVPEPGTALLVALGTAGLAHRSRRARRQVA